MPDWLDQAAAQLGVEFDIPFRAVLRDGTRIDALARLRNFGGVNGMLRIDSMQSEKVFRRVDTEGYGFLVIDSLEAWDPFDLEGIKSVLADWGWSGDPARIPDWLAQYGLRAPPNDASGDVFRRLEAHGFDLGRPHDVEFFAIFPTEEAADRVAKQYVADDEAGETLANVETRPRDEGGMELVVVKSMLVTYPNVAQFEAKLGRRADAEGGRLDGWGVMQDE